jgi:Domain of unknown function (DUF4440)
MADTSCHSSSLAVATHETVALRFSQTMGFDMQRIRNALLAVVAGYLCAAGVVANAQVPSEERALTNTIAALDAKVFDAYNSCDLKTFGEYFVPKVEFYHDTGGATFDRKTVMDNTRKYICHKVRRELLAATFKVYAIKDYGAISEGEHRFCELASGQCEGIAKFLMIWRNTNNTWQVTKVVSYGHRAMSDVERAALAPLSKP